MGVQEQRPASQLDAENTLSSSDFIQQTTIEVDNRRIFFLSSDSPLATDRRCTVVLVHDQINDSFVWSEIKTIQALVARGYRCVALDLPSIGRSQGPSLESPNERGDFLQNFLDSIQKSEDESFVLVAASMAGQYLIPFLNLQESSAARCRLIGVVGVALSDTQNLLPTLRIPPTLVIRGELDTSIGLSASTAFKSFENVRQFVIPNGKHLCHLGNPELFNRVLVDFLNGLHNDS